MQILALTLMTLCILFVYLYGQFLELRAIDNKLRRQSNKDRLTYVTQKRFIHMCGEDHNFILHETHLRMNAIRAAKSKTSWLTRKLSARYRNIEASLAYLETFQRECVYIK